MCVVTVVAIELQSNSGRCRLHLKQSQGQLSINSTPHSSHQLPFLDLQVAGIQGCYSILSPKIDGMTRNLTWNSCLHGRHYNYKVAVVGAGYNLHKVGWSSAKESFKATYPSNCHLKGCAKLMVCPGSPVYFADAPTFEMRTGTMTAGI